MIGKLQYSITRKAAKILALASRKIEVTQQLSIKHEISKDIFSEEAKNEIKKIKEIKNGK